MTKMYNQKHLQDPYLLFERRTQLIRSRIQMLLIDYINVKCYISRAIIIDEIERLVDDYIERQLVLQKGNTKEEVLDLPKTPKEKLEYDIKIVQYDRVRAKIENFYYERFYKEML